MRCEKIDVLSDVSGRRQRKCRILIELIVFCAVVAYFFAQYRADDYKSSALVVSTPELPAPLLDFAKDVVSPTDADILADSPDKSIFMPTASGRVTSAMYGSVRTASNGRARFHEGIDITPQHRGRRGRPTDVVRSIADGCVAYINKVGGDSNYGVHVFVEHEDPIGKVYTLYAHLASVTNSISKGMKITAGTPLGIVGNSGNLNIPAVRSHLHFEIGLFLAENFGKWCDKNKYKPNRGMYHGWNLYSLDPVSFFRQKQSCTGIFSFEDYVKSVPPALFVAFAANKMPSYFKRYPSLWFGREFAMGDLICCALSESGFVLSGRVATAEEAIGLSSKNKLKVISVDSDVLGRNGVHLVKKSKNGSWAPDSALELWYNIFTFN